MSSIAPTDQPNPGEPTKIDVTIVARDLKLPPEKIDATVELLDQGNTISFITRFRKDLTGGLDERQIQAIKNRVAQLRALGERKEFVLKSIDSQGKLTDELKTEIGKASTSRRLEDLYLPFKPKKQSRALVARQQGLEPLADDIFNGISPDVDLATRATDFVRVDKGLKTVDEVFKGVRDLLAERFSDKEELRGTLRKILWDLGKLKTQVIEPKPNSGDEQAAKTDEAITDASSETVTDAKQKSLPQQPAGETVEDKQPQSESKSEPKQSAVAEVSAEKTASAETSPAQATTEAESTSADPTPTDATSTETAASESASTETSESETTSVEKEQPTSDAAEESAGGEPAANQPTAESAAAGGTIEKPKKKKKKKKKKKVEDPYKDYREFEQGLKELPHHRILAINRGERAGKLKAKISIDNQKLEEPTFAALVPAEHPFKEFMQKCAGDALNRTIVPSLEREIRRELTDAAEKHAVEVFANNLRNLLLQPPLRNQTVLAIDPGFKRGCSVAVVDPCGTVLDSGHIFVVGNQKRRDESKQKLIDWLNQHRANVIAIGNGAACRQTEQLVSDLLAENPDQSKIKYVMVNEAGASIYSTSEIGREEMPDAAPSIRSAVSIGRRLQDPLSELVKISPANIGVGMYQHDVKAKHLSESLDDVVAFCVNQVGVNVNTASPSLLKYVSGLNALTARRLVEHREANGKFANREQLKQVSGVGDATFVQAAGFLRIHGGDTPLDSTSIHPESYGLADEVLKRANVSVAELFIRPKPVEPRSEAKKVLPADAKPDAEKTEKAVAVEAPAAANTATEATSSEANPATAEELKASEAMDSGTENTETVAAPAPAAEATKPDSPGVKPESKTGEADTGVDPKTESAKTESAKTELAKPEPVPPAPAPKPAPRLSPEDLAKRKEILKRISELDIAEIAKDHSAGRMLVKDVLMALKRPDWDPRGNSKKLIFRSGIIKSDDLKLEMQLEGQVVNVVDFGVFVDIGLGESSLVHVSQLSNHFVRDPHQLYAVGDVLKVWVSEIDTERRRVKLTAVRPGSKKAPPKRRRRYEGSKTDGKPEERSGARSGPGKPAGKFGGGRKYEGSNPSRSRSYSKGSSYKDRPKHKSKPKPVKPITESMLEGKEPMRSFSDLAQFVKSTPKKKGDSGEDSETQKG